MWTDYPRETAAWVLRRLFPEPLRATIKSYRAASLPGSRWDTEYAAGAWQRLRSVGELPRYSVIVGYCRHYRPFGSVLDIGCGEGLLAQWLGNDCSAYLGVDLSAEAISLARAKNFPFAEFVVANASDFKPASQFDIIAFNECLYYFARPLDVAARLADALAPGGVVIVSLNQGVASRQIWRMLRDDFRERDGVEIRSGNAVWKVAVLQPGPGRDAIGGCPHHGTEPRRPASAGRMGSLTGSASPSQGWPLAAPFLAEQQGSRSSGPFRYARSPALIPLAR